MTRNRFSAVLAITAVSVLAATGSAPALTHTWIQGGDPTNWEDPLNWDSNGVPPQTTAGTDIVFSSSTSGDIGNNPSTGKVTFGSMSWETSFTLRDFGHYTTWDGLVADTGTSANAVATISNGANMFAYYTTWRLNSDLELTGSGRLTTRAHSENGIRGPGGFIVGPGTELYLQRSHGSSQHIYTGGVTIRNGGLVDTNGRSAGHGALGDGLLTIEEGGLLQSAGTLDQNALFDINTNGTASPFIVGTTTATGTWTFDLTDAGSSVGDSWSIISGATYGAGFSVDGFSEESPGVWSSGNVGGAWYEFDESTGLLSVVQPPLGDLLITKFLDDCDGVYEGTEPLLSGWSFRVDGQGPYVTDSSGSVLVSGLTPGLHTIDEILKTNWINCTPMPYEVMIEAGQTAEVYIGNRVIPEPATVLIWSLLAGLACSARRRTK
jgi:hypothetical protein